MKTMLLISILLFSSLSFSKKTLGLNKGVLAPEIVTTDINENLFNLKKALRSGPVVLIFYRGGWCPFCNTQLRSLQKEIVPKLKNYKAQLVTISTDKLSEAVKTKGNEKLDMTIISDPEAKLLKAYNVVYKVPNDLVKTYKTDYKIDLEKFSGRKHHIIAVPSAFVIGQDGKIAFSYSNEDYKVRAQNKDILSALAHLKKTLL